MDFTGVSSTRIISNYNWFLGSTLYWQKETDNKQQIQQ